MADESTIVTAVGISVNTIFGEDVNRRLERAMSDAVLECNAGGITTEEKNSSTIRAAMAVAHRRVMDEVASERRAL